MGAAPVGRGPAALQCGGLRGSRGSAGWRGAGAGAAGLRLRLAGHASGRAGNTPPFLTLGTGGGGWRVAHSRVYRNLGVTEGCQTALGSSPLRSDLKGRASGKIPCIHAHPGCKPGGLPWRWRSMLAPFPPLSTL